MLAFRGAAWDRDGWQRGVAPPNKGWMMKSIKVLLAVSLAALTLGTVAPSASAASCVTPWGSLLKASGPMVSRSIVNIRAGQHACFDRLVVDVSGRARPGYTVQYVNQVLSDPKGATVPLSGGADLQVVVRAPAYNITTGASTLASAGRSNMVKVNGFRTFRQVAWAGSFEGVTTIGLGVRARLPFRVFTLVGPGNQVHLVVDVAHHW
jgi:hypothetical protein